MEIRPEKENETHSFSNSEFRNSDLFSPYFFFVFYSPSEVLFIEEKKWGHRNLKTNFLSFLSFFKFGSQFFDILGLPFLKI